MAKILERSLRYFSCILLYNNLLLHATEELPRLANDVLHLTYTGRPVCAYFKHTATSPDYEKLISNFLTSKDAIKYVEWTIGSVNIEDLIQISPPPNLHPSLVPSLQCDIGLQLPLEFMFQNKSLKSLKKWFNHVLREHSTQPKFVTTSSELENAILNNGKGITVLMITEMEYLHSVKSIVKKVRKYEVNDNVPLNVLITRPEYVEHWKQKELSQLENYPAVLFFTHEVWARQKSFAYVLQGHHEVSTNSIQLVLVAVASKFVFMDEQRFHNEILDTKYQLSPKLVFVFSYFNPDSLKYFMRFHQMRKRLDCEGVLLEFRLMDIGKRNNSLVFSRHINGSKINMFPVFVLFWQEMTATYEIEMRQEVLNELLTADKLFSVLVKNGIFDKSERKHDYNVHCIQEIDDHELECANLAYSRGVCKANTTLMGNDDYMFHNLTPNRQQKKQKKHFAKRRKTGNLTVLTDEDWSATIEASSFSSSTKRLRRIDDSAVLSLVFFIIKKCRYCGIIMPQIEKLAQTIRRSGKANVYLVNCSMSPAICKYQNVQGFPSVKLFRNLPWSQLGGCVTDHIQQQYIALDYHRPLEPVDLILEWFSNSSLPSVKKNFLLRNFPKQLNHDVYLVGTVITRSQALRFLPPHSHKKWYPYGCYQTACELLFGKATCYATITKDFAISKDMRETKNKDLFLVKLELFRSDGIGAKIFELGVPLTTTMRNEQDSELHKFHNAHSYSLEKAFRCEDNHSQCTEFIVKFVRDHSRLPVTRLSHDGFHTVNRIFSDRTGQPEELPVVVVLAHEENITNSSLYLKEITKAAYELYRDVIFTSLDVDEYPWWARQFVPRDYDTTQMARSSDLAYTPPLYHFPRLCIVRTSDHHQAAFLPSLEIMDGAKNISKLLRSIDAKEVVNFVKQYLQTPELLLVKTEEF